jgi:hypothetical protein
MVLLDYIQVKTSNGFADIELYHGDLSAIPKEHKVDIVILSAFPNDYTPTPGTLIGSFAEKGLSVEQLAQDKEMDLRKNLWCWFSKALNPAQQAQFNLQHILCFEPEKRLDEAAEYVADIFRCLNNFAFDDDHNHVAMPTVAAGNQQASAIKITAAIIEAATFWLQRGLPLLSIKIIEINEAKAIDLKKVFAQYKEPELAAITQEAVRKEEPRNPVSSTKTAPISKEADASEIMQVRDISTGMQPAVDAINGGKKPSEEFDFFVSYSHKNKEHVRYFIDSLRQKYPSLRVFYDSDSIPKGGQWLREISRCIDRSRKVLIFLSKEFDESPACWDEFQCAKVRQNKTGKNIIMNIYLLNHPELPSMFEIFNWIDCREADKQKLDSAIVDVINSMEN